MVLIIVSAVELVGQDNEEDISEQNDSSSDCSNTKGSAQDVFNAFSAWLQHEGEFVWQDLALMVITIGLSLTLSVVAGVGVVLVGPMLLHALNITEQDNNSVSGGGNIGNNIILPTLVQTSATPVLPFAIPPADPIPPTTSFPLYRRPSDVDDFGHFRVRYAGR